MILLCHNISVVNSPTWDQSQAGPMKVQVRPDRTATWKLLSQTGPQIENVQVGPMGPDREVDGVDGNFIFFLN